MSIIKEKATVVSVKRARDMIPPSKTNTMLGHLVIYYVMRLSILSTPLSRLLSRKLSLHLPPRCKNHLIPPPLQRSLPLISVRAPPLTLGILLLLRRSIQLVLKVIPSDKIRLRWLIRLSRRRRCAAARCGLARRRRRLESHGGLVVILVSKRPERAMAQVQHTVSSRPASIRSVVLWMFPPLRCRSHRILRRSACGNICCILSTAISLDRRKASGDRVG